MGGLRIESHGRAGWLETRWRAFSRTVLPPLLTEGAPPTLLYVPSYFDFVRVRGEVRADVARTTKDLWSLHDEESDGRAR